MSPGSGPEIVKGLLVWSTSLVGGRPLRGREISWIQLGLGVTDGPGGVKGRSVAHRAKPQSSSFQPKKKLAAFS